MTSQKLAWKQAVADAVRSWAGESQAEDVQGLDQALQALPVERPPRPEMGEIAIPLFSLSRVLRKGPPAIASAVVERITAPDGAPGTASAAGPYVNVRLDRAALTAALLPAVLGPPPQRGPLTGQRVVVEFSCPNTNKPLHLGHLRNDAIGESVSRILSAAGAAVVKVNLINDRGIHICKSMLAYQQFGEGETPESRGMKPDHFVGDFYVRYNTWAKEDQSAEPRAQQMLRAWEAGDPETVALWERMNGWAIQGIQQTYDRTGISFDRYDYESQTYQIGREEVLRGLRAGTFFRAEDGSIQVDLSDVNLDTKVLLRRDGTSLYLTQDIGTAIERQRSIGFDRLIHVVGSEQRYHFQVLFEVLARLGFPWASSLHHLAYGMVNLPEGKMKSREGTVVDADDLLDELSAMALAEIREKARIADESQVTETAEAIALGALHYFLLQTGAAKDMVFDPKQSLSFTGDTGPYLQYVGARVSSMLARAEADGLAPAEATDSPAARLLDREEEWDLVVHLAGFAEAVHAAAADLNPSIVAAYLYELARRFSRYYHDVPIATASERPLAAARLLLSVAVQRVMEQGMTLLNIPFVRAM